MNPKIRSRIYNFFSKFSNTSAGKMKPTWLVFIRAVLFPLDYFYYTIGKNKGYDIYTDPWKIHGITYSDELLRDVSMLYNGVFRVVKRENGCVTIERLPPSQDYAPSC